MRRRGLAQLQQDVGRRVAELRTELGATQAEIAEKAGVSAHYWQRIEAGAEAFTLRTLAWLADVFRVDASALLELPKARPRRRAGRPRKT